MDYNYAGYGGASAYPGYYHGGLDVGYSAYHSMPYLYHPGIARERGFQEKQPESKPRLSKDEVELLEAHFRQNPKPSSSVKRELAERMRVELPRINNWFQNRRAKAKLERNQEEYKARQEATAKAASQSPTQDQQPSSVQEHFQLSNQQAPLQPCVASFGSSSPSTTNQPCDSSDDLTNPNSVSPVAQSSQSTPEDDGMFTPTSNGYAIMQPASDDVSEIFDLAPSTHDLVGFDSLRACPDVAAETFQMEPALVPALRHIDFASQSIATEMAGENSHDINSSDTASPSIMPSPPAPTEFKPPPPAADLAVRRNRRPLGLSTFSSYQGQSALRTTAGDMPRRSDTTSPIRRITSSTGCAPPRVVKPTAGSAPRSPMLSEQKREALLQSLQGGHAPAPGLSINATVAAGPPTPRTPMYMCHPGMGENTASSTCSDDEMRAGYSYQQTQVASFIKMEDQSIKTPPGTPGVVGFPETMYAPNTIESAFNFLPGPEEPLFTPGIQPSTGFPPELDFNHTSLGAPEYVGTSQPPTPSFPPTSFAQNTLSAAAYLSTAEYHWPEAAMAAYTRSSPPTKSKTFQFAPNMTPQHFNGDK